MKIVKEQHVPYNTGWAGEMKKGQVIRITATTVMVMSQPKHQARNDLDWTRLTADRPKSRKTAIGRHLRSITLCRKTDERELIPTGKSDNTVTFGTPDFFVVVGRRRLVLRLCRAP